MQLFHEYRVGLTQDVAVFFGDFAEYAYAETGAGERMAIDHVVGQP